MRLLTSIIQLFLLVLLLTVPFSTASAAPVMTSPTAGSTLTQSTQTFTWGANGTAGINEWYVYLGTTGVGSVDIFAGSQGLNTSTTISGLPTDGSTLYFRLWYRTTFWNRIDVTYTACNSCASSVPNITMTDPVDGSTFLESYKTFHWQATNISVLEWYLYVGTSVGNNSIYASSQGTATQVTVSGLPTNGSTVYVRLWYRTTNGWSFQDLTYTSCSGACINLPHLSIQKTSNIINDGVNVSNPKRIPGATLEYTITVTNSGLGTADANSIIINDSIPPDTDYVASSLQFLNNTSGLNAVAALSDSGGNMQVTPQGTFLASSGSGDPSFQIKFRVKVK
ncbi:MAG: hypothetical protein L3J51_03225 [Cocleimonas sp.]|nr:hypothetical protein [Cocleimonas sp.]